MWPFPKPRKPAVKIGAEGTACRNAFEAARCKDKQLDWWTWQIAWLVCSDKSGIPERHLTGEKGPRACLDAGFSYARERAFSPDAYTWPKAWHACEATLQASVPVHSRAVATA